MQKVSKDLENYGDFNFCSIHLCTKYLKILKKKFNQTSVEKSRMRESPTNIQENKQIQKFKPLLLLKSIHVSQLPLSNLKYS